MGWSLTIGRIAGIRVELHFTFLLAIGWIAVQYGLLTGQPGQAIVAVVTMLLVFVCVLLHELGHALTARRYGIPTRDITLLPIGGVARLAHMPDKPSQEIVVAIAGPLVNVALALLLAVFVRPFSRPVEELLKSDSILVTLLAVNVVMILFNMIPAFPMDGGRVLRAVLTMRIGYARATSVAARVGQGIAILFGMVGLLGVPGLFGPNVMLMFIALFVFVAASEERSHVQTRSTIHGLPVRSAMVTDFHALNVRDPLQRAVDYLMAGSQQDFPVVDGANPVGVLTRSELVSALGRRGSDVPVGDVVRRDSEYAAEDEPLDMALQRMRETGRLTLPVLRAGSLVGLLTLDNIGDLLLVREALRRHAGHVAV
jgi:Zn-dependent protease/CBS domain-containing protein